MRKKARIFVYQDFRSIFYWVWKLRWFGRKQKLEGKMSGYIAPISGQVTPSQYTTPTPRTPYPRSQILPSFKHFSKVNPDLLIQWEGQSSKTDIIMGAGILKVSQRAKDITKKGNLLFSLQAKQWHNNKPIGNIKMIDIHYFEDKDKALKSIVKEVRKYEGECLDLSKHGYGEYTIEYHYSNEHKQVTIVKGEWSNDFLLTGTIIKDNKQKMKVNMQHNIQMDNERLTQTRKTLQPIDLEESEQKQQKAIPKNGKIEKNPKIKRQQNMLEPPQLKFKK